jgi:hypothetical protein
MLAYVTQRSSMRLVLTGRSGCDYISSDVSLHQLAEMRLSG